ncbi:MAG: phage distal tail protein, Rcc01695 family, partial [Beijerinckiaceae bacterium]
ERNARWAHARRRYDAGYGVRSLSALSQVIAFFEERRGRLHGFRFRDRLDFRSSAGGQPPQAGDQKLGTGDGVRAAFPLVKTYGQDFAPYARPITKPVQGSVLVAVSGLQKAPGVDFLVDLSTGIVTFQPGKLPAAGALVTAGFQFDVPVRFDTDRLEIDLASFEAGEIPAIPLIEITP